MALRAYQQSALDAARDRFRIGKRRVLLVAPTGAGKTVLFCVVIRGHLDRAGRVLLVVHRRELLTQARARLILEGIPEAEIGVIVAGEPRNPTARVQIASIGTLLGLPELPPASLLVFDEAHHFVAEQWGTIAAQYTDARIIGVTATPERSDGAPLGDLFDELVVVASVRELTDQSFLVPCSVIAPPKKRKTNAQSPLAAYREHAFGRPGVIFCASVKEARDVADQFTADGIASACVDGETDETVRADRLAAFERREISVLTNCFVLTEGWDAPIAEVCILARGCSSVGTFLQMVGRVLRPAPGKTDALLIDLRGVVHTHGLPDEERTFSLDGKPIGRGPTKKCHACETKIPLAAMVCPLCGEECPPARSLMGRFEAGEPLSRIDRAAIERAFWDEQIAEARRRGFKLGWAVHRFTEKFGRFPAKLWRELPCDVAPSTSTIREGAR